MKQVRSISAKTKVGKCRVSEVNSITESLQVTFELNNPEPPFVKILENGFAFRLSIQGALALYNLLQMQLNDHYEKCVAREMYVFEQLNPEE